MPKQNQKTPKRSNHRIIESDDESHDSEHTPRTVNKGDDTEQGSDTEKDTDDKDYDSLSAPGSLAKDIETAERDIDQYGTNLSTKNKKTAKNNPYSAQNKLDQASDPDSFDNRLALLQVAATEKSAQRKQRAIKKREKEFEI